MANLPNWFSLPFWQVWKYRLRRLISAEKTYDTSITSNIHLPFQKNPTLQAPISPRHHTLVKRPGGVWIDYH